MKIVINACFGGFSLSHEGVLAYITKKGLTAYPEFWVSGKSDHYTYWTVPESERPGNIEYNWYERPLEERRAYNATLSRIQVSNRDIPRDDKDLIAVVEELGDKANGACAQLKVVEIPDETHWVIEEYDGNEHVAEAHGTWG